MIHLCIFFRVPSLALWQIWPDSLMHICGTRWRWVNMWYHPVMVTGSPAHGLTFTDLPQQGILLQQTLFTSGYSLRINIFLMSCLSNLITSLNNSLLNGMEVRSIRIVKVLLLVWEVGSQLCYYYRARLFSKSSLARPQEFWNSSIFLYEIKKKNQSKSTCLTGNFTCPRSSGSGKRWALY